MLWDPETLLVRQKFVYCFTSRPSSTLLSRGMEKDEEKKEEGSRWDIIFNLCNLQNARLLMIYPFSFSRFTNTLKLMYGFFKI